MIVLANVYMDVLCQGIDNWFAIHSRGSSAGHVVQTGSAGLGSHQSAHSW